MKKKRVHIYTIRPNILYTYCNLGMYFKPDEVELRKRGGTDRDVKLYYDDNCVFLEDKSGAQDIYYACFWHLDTDNYFLGTDTKAVVGEDRYYASGLWFGWEGDLTPSAEDNFLRTGHFYYKNGWQIGYDEFAKAVPDFTQSALERLRASVDMIEVEKITAYDFIARGERC